MSKKVKLSLMVAGIWMATWMALTSQINVSNTVMANHNNQIQQAMEVLK